MQPVGPNDTASSDPRRPPTLTDVARDAGVTRWIAGAILNGGADAIVAHDDFFAAVLLKRLRAKGIRVPDDVAVVGSLNHYLADRTDPPLTTLDPCPADAARAMVEAAERLVAGEAVAPGAVARIAPRLIVRESA